MDKILQATDKIVNVFEYLNREKIELNSERSQVRKILRELVEEKFTSTNKQSTQGCVICGCNISLKGYCAGCQTRI